MLSNRVFLTSIVFVSACATTGTLGVETDNASRARVQLAPLSADDTVRLVPHAIDPLLPSADRLSHVIQSRLGDEASVDVRYCVSPAGTVISAELARSSTLPAFDQAVMNDITAWKFAAQPGPDHLRTCDAATIVYRARG